jgi:hypothetical protein
MSLFENEMKTEREREERKREKEKERKKEKEKERCKFTSLRMEDIVCFGFEKSA